MTENDNHIIDYLQSMCTTDGSVDFEGTWMLLIQDDVPLNHNDFERLKKAVRGVSIDDAKNLILLKFRERIEFVFLKGKIFVGQKGFDKDKNDSNLKFRNLDDIIYADKKDCISLGWNDAVDAMFQGAKQVCSYRLLDHKYKNFQDAMLGLQDNDGIHHMFGVKAYNKECFHQTCRQYWKESKNENFLKLKEMLTANCNHVCLFYKKGVVQNNEKNPSGLFAKPLQFSNDYADKLLGKPYKYDWQQLETVDETFPECIEMPHFVKLYESENKRFTVKNVVYCRVKPWGIYIGDSTQIRVLTRMKELLYDNKDIDENNRLDIRNDYKPLSSYNLNRESHLNK